MNMIYSKHEKAFGFLAFFLIGYIGFVTLFIQSQFLKYPAETGAVFGIVPVAVRLIFNYSEIKEVIYGAAGNSETQRTDSDARPV